MNATACFECGAPAQHDHHVVPRSLGGTRTVPLCRICHGRAHGRERGFRPTNELTRDALLRLRARGVKLGGAALGWKRADATDADGRRVIATVEHEAVAVARIRDLRAQGLTLRAIAGVLATEGHATKAGGRWHPQTIARVIAREVQS